MTSTVEHRGDDIVFENLSQLEINEFTSVRGSINDNGGKISVRVDFYSHVFESEHVNLTRSVTLREHLIDISESVPVLKKKNILILRVHL